MIAEVISIGDEMTSGARLDTNAQWLSRRLGELGVSVEYHSTVGDTLAHNIDVFRIAADRADVIVATGGLGPTRDDLTREALAAASTRPLVRSEAAMQHIETMFARRKRPMPARNEVQAMFPEGSLEIFNPQGTAPGIDITLGNTGAADSESFVGRIFALPGVPAEMKRMFDDTVAPRILAAASERGQGHGTKIHHCVMKFFGTGESDMEERLGDMIDRDRSPRVGITVSAATISLRISATGTTDQQCLDAIARTREEILSRVKEYYFGDGEEFEQQNAIDSQLRALHQSLAVIELGRAAPLGDWFAALGQTPSYRGGLSLAGAADLMGMFDADSIETAIATVADRFEVDWVLMVDGYPVLDANSDRPMPAAEVQIRIGSPGRSITETQVVLGGHPSIVQPRIAKAAMASLRMKLAKLSPS